MKNTTTYEWKYEETGEFGDIVDHAFGSTISEISDNTPEEGNSSTIVLVKFTGNPKDGIKSRAYAYPVIDILPKYFDDGRPVPEKYRIEFENHFKTQQHNEKS